MSVEQDRSAVWLPPSASPSARFNAVSVFGVPVTDCSFDEGIQRLRRLVDSKKSSTVFCCHYQTLNLAAVDQEFRSILGQADIVFGDGLGVRWAARARGVSLKANLNGTDLIPALLSRPSGLRNRYFLLGAGAGAIARASAYAQAQFPEWTLAGSHHGYLDARRSDEAVELINASEVDLLLVGMGSPLQERWIVEHGSRLKPCCAVSVGGLFSYWSGDLQRAPVWMRQMRAEWLYLLCRQPRKLGRYSIGSSLFLWRMLRLANRELGGRPAKELEFN